MQATQVFFCPETAGFFLNREEASVRAVPISMEEHARLFAQQAEGATIRAGEDGRPVAVRERREPTPAEIATAVDAARQVAYTAEADPLFFKAQRGEASMEDWRAKVAEIKARYPDGRLPG